VRASPFARSHIPANYFIAGIRIADFSALTKNFGRQSGSESHSDSRFAVGVSRKLH